MLLLICSALTGDIGAAEPAPDDSIVCQARKANLQLEVRPVHAEDWQVGVPRAFRLTIKNVGNEDLMLPTGPDLKGAFRTSLTAIIWPEPRPGRGFEGRGMAGGLMVASEFRRLRPGESFDFERTLTAAMPVEYELAFRFSSNVDRQVTFEGRNGRVEKVETLVPQAWKGTLECRCKASAVREVPLARRELEKAFHDLAARDVASKEAQAAFRAAAVRDDWISVQFCLECLRDPKLRDIYAEAFQRLTALAGKGLLAIDFERYVILAQRESAWRARPGPVLDVLALVADPNEIVLLSEGQGTFVPSGAQRTLAWKQLQSWGRELPNPLSNAAKEIVIRLQPKVDAGERKEKEDRAKAGPPLSLAPPRRSPPLSFLPLDFE